MRYLAIGMIWLGVSTATAVTAGFDPKAAVMVGLVGFICATITTVVLQVGIAND